MKLMGWRLARNSGLLPSKWEGSMGIREVSVVGFNMAKNVDGYSFSLENPRCGLTENIMAMAMGTSPHLPIDLRHCH